MENKGNISSSGERLLRLRLANGEERDKKCKVSLIISAVTRINVNKTHVCNV